MYAVTGYTARGLATTTVSCSMPLEALVPGSTSGAIAGGRLVSRNGVKRENRLNGLMVEPVATEIMRMVFPERKTTPAELLPPQ